MADTRLFRWNTPFFALFISLALSACGGGGGGSDPGFIGGGAGGGDEEATTFTFELVLTNSDGEVTDNVTSVEPATLTVTLTDGRNPAAGEVVAAEADIGQVQPATGLTDENGVVTFSVEAGTDLGGGTIIVSAGEDTASTTFQVGQADLRMGSRDAGGNFVQGVLDVASGDASLPPGGTTTVSALVVNADETGIDGLEVLFSSGCAATDPATAELTPSVTTSNGGQATATYTAQGCVGTDAITASVVGGNTQQASGAVSIVAAPANSLSFISATPTTIALKGTGGQGRQEFSTLEFQVFDTTGAAAEGVAVTFGLSTDTGGITLTNADPATGETVVISNEQGLARATVQAGNVATAVRVNARIESEGQTLTVPSDQLLISTGLPDQNSFSVSVSLLNFSGGDEDGLESAINIRMADKFNNPVPDGTSVVFTTEYGSIPAGCETIVGGCSVNLLSQDPRLPEYDAIFPDQVRTIFNTNCPSLFEIEFVAGTDPDTGEDILVPTTVPARRACPDALGDTFGRRSAVLVHAIGEETFQDQNGNGVYDENEPHTDLPEAFLDHNEDGVFSRADGYCDGMPIPESVVSCTDSATSDVCIAGSEESFQDFNNNGCYDSVTAVSPVAGAEVRGMYNGSLCPVDGDGVFCSRELVHVFDNATVVLSNHSYDFFLTQGGVEYNGSLRDGTSYVLYIADVFNNRPAAGAVVTVASEGCELGSANSVGVSNSNAKGAFAIGISLLTPENGEPANGKVTISVANPDGDSPAPLVVGCSVGGGFIL